MIYANISIKTFRNCGLIEVMIVNRYGLNEIMAVIGNNRLYCDYPDCSDIMISVCDNMIFS